MELTFKLRIEQGEYEEDRKFQKEIDIEKLICLTAMMKQKISLLYIINN